MELDQRIAVAGQILARLHSKDARSVVGLLSESGFPQSLEEHLLQGGAIQDVLRVADENLLLGLLERLEATPRPADDHDSGWRWGRLRLFLSHVSPNKQFVHDVADVLDGYAVSSFVAHDDIAPTQEWQTEIERRLRNCDALAAFLAPGFRESKWTDQEVGYCLFREVLIVPVRLGVTPYGFIAKYQGLQGEHQTADAVAVELFNILRTHQLTRRLMAGALLHFLLDSPSYDESRRRWALLKDASPDWSEEMLAKLEMGVVMNGQIRDANYEQLGPTIVAFIKARRDAVEGAF